MTGLPATGAEPVTVDHERITELWDPWSPTEVADRLAGVTRPWAVVGGWAIDLHLGRQTRPHGDIEIAVPAAAFGAVRAALAGYGWDVAGDGRLWRYPAAVARHHQTWLRDEDAGRYRLDVFREPHGIGAWVFRRNPSLRMPYADAIAHTADGIPYLIPELVLLFKAALRSAKDEQDLAAVRATLAGHRWDRFLAWLVLVDPHHPWIARR